MIRILALMLVVGFPVQAWCQDAAPPGSETLTLEKALELARTHNWSVKNAALEVTKAQDTVAAAKTKRLPALDFSVYGAHHLTEEGYTFKQGSLGTLSNNEPIPPQNVTIGTTPHFTTLVTVSAELPLLHQYRIALGIDRLEVGEQIATQDLRSQRQKTAKDVKDAYYGILQTQAALKATRETIVFLRELDKLVDRYVQDQRVLKSDSLEVKTELAKMEHQELTQRNTLASYKEQLNAMLGRAVDTEFQVSPVPPKPPAEVDAHAAEESALAQRPVVKEAQLKVKEAEYGLRMKRSEYLPDVSLAVRYTSPFGVELLPENLATVGVYARWDVFDWGRKKQELGEKAAEIEQAHNQVQAAQAQAVADANKSVRNLQAARALVPVTRLAQDTAREKLRVALNKYKESSALLQDVLKAESALGDANRDYQEAQLGVWAASADLQKALGEE